MLPPAKSQIPSLYQEALGLQKAGEAEAALAIYRRILTVVPGQGEVLFQVGRLQTRAGDLEAAEASLRKALKAKPGEAAIWQALHAVLEGAARRQLEREAARARVPLGLAEEAAPIFGQIAKGEADRALKQALALVRAAPAAAAPAHALGAAHLALGNWAAALPALETARDRAPGDGAVLLDLAQALARLGRPLRALSVLDEAAAAGAETTLPRAAVLRDICRIEEASEVLAAAAAARKAPAGVHRENALTLAALRRADAARKALAPALKARPERALSLRRELASALTDEGEIEAAQAVLGEALAARPDDAGLLVQRGQLRQTVGDLAGAEADLTRAIEIAPRTAEAYRAYANGRRSAPDDPVAAALAGQLGQADLDARTRRVMSFAAAKFAADRGDTEVETGHLERANRLMAQAFPYSFDADLESARRLAADWRSLEGMTREGPAEPVVFVTGLPRSGTTLVESVLAAHPDVTAGGEMPFLSRALAPAIEGLRDGAPDAARFAEAGRRYLTAARRRTGATAVIADKAISTFSRIGHAAAALPGARFVVLRRDPRDTGLSLWRNMFAEGLHRYAYDQVQMARYIRLHEALVAFWAERLVDRVHVLDYEALTSDPEPEIRRLVAFCGLAWDEACLSPHAARRNVATLSFAQVRQPIGRGSVAGWRRFEAGLGDLLAELDRTARHDLQAPD
ncbi:sulfotransferase [Roseibacterium sp. SDUM158017]|uniref:tetratricopeptide repeat-containing sulfotransferase family protein n=1 Tax=Roseicyclus salinarum TaxID=3036773 RepID=UPI0024152CDB|nr:tetratricopeptide repeat-containing sulfotransferase family protein [Roseibacterium sp. SDUM158017]MDG4648327.1 sulfotransferase [Roseibacterium sp. SDUM158017]